MVFYFKGSLNEMKKDIEKRKNDGKQTEYA
jgi:hypothetical protein